MPDDQTTAWDVIAPWADTDAGFGAILAVDGDLDAVLADLEQQIDDLNAPLLRREVEEIDGRSWIYLSTGMG